MKTLRHSLRAVVVAAGKRRGRKRRTPTTDIVALTGLTYWELWALANALQLAEARFNSLTFADTRTWTYEDVLEDYKRKENCDISLPWKLVKKLKQLVERLQQPPWTQNEIKRYRWHSVRRLVDCGHKQEDAWKIASTACAGTPAEAGASMMKDAFLEFENSLPEGERCPRRRRRPSSKS